MSSENDREPRLSEDMEKEKDENNNDISQPLIPFEENSSIIVTGSSKSGKTYWINKFLKNIDQMFEGRPPEEVLYFYLHDRPLYSEMKENLKDRISACINSR